MEHASGPRSSPGTSSNGTGAGPRESLAGMPDLVPTGPRRAAPPPRSADPDSSTAAAQPSTAAREPAAATDSPPVDWTTAMRRAIRCPDQLRRQLGLAPAPLAAGSAPRSDSFATFVPLEFLARIRPGDPDDPLLRQVLPSEAEEAEDARFAADPVGDTEALAAGGVLHKYPGRALVISTGACGIHCRYCFRREFPYNQSGSRREAWQPSIDYLRGRSEIDEVLLSGGDPLTLVDDQLARLIDQLAGIAHLRRLRIHSRMPVVIPQRITPALIEQLRETRLTVWMVIHVNHPRELDAAVLERVGRLIDQGIPVLNQAVLLRGVNDCAETLTQLCRKLVDHRIQPYYLHQLDRVRGTTHFEVPVAEGLRLIEQLRTELPGYAVPTYVAEQAGESSKTPLFHVPT